MIITREIPQECRSSNTVPVYRKSEKKDPRNYRVISRLNAVMKLSTKIITQHSSGKSSTNEQQDFRRNRPTIGAIFILKLEVHRIQAFDRVQL